MFYLVSDMFGEISESMPSGLTGDYPFSTYVKLFKKTRNFYPLIRQRMYAYQGVRIVSFSENFAYILNG